eukprot:TRINITY_DN5079_c0_g1_i1.p1 TRINITY_DN5079_c0_g1~~TRINITY_DN5079_c0_g1_i1.p1  ORF type:complete len:309 (+),score=85.48 TRINITY_DN5079_c0_g1_i1:228-1154(+)
MIAPAAHSATAVACFLSTRSSFHFSLPSCFSLDHRICSFCSSRPPSQVLAAMDGDVLTSTAKEDRRARQQQSGRKRLPGQGQLRAVLFDVDGTLTDSDPLHFKAFQDILVEVGFQGGIPIDDEFFRKHISGRHNPDIGADLFPDWTVEKRMQLLMEKEARFRKLVDQKQLKEVKGLFRFCEWVKERGLKRAAVTNAPRENAEQMISGLGLNDFFDALVIGSECQRAKPYPDPYLEGMRLLGVAAHEAFALEDSPSGTRAAVAAGLPCVGVLTSQPPSSLLAVGAAMVVTNFLDPVLWQELEADGGAGQ